MIEYGITTSKAHVWVHVCPLDAAVYFYARARMVAILDKLPAVEIVSAKGRLCRLKGNRACDGGFIHDINPPIDWWSRYQFATAESDDAVGEYAEELFARCVTERLFQIPASISRYDDRTTQFTGRDFHVKPLLLGLDVEVKADVRGGEWGTGNLFVQTHELNHKHGERNAHREALRA